MLEDALVHSISLAAAMDARGFGRRGDVSERTRRLTVFLTLGYIFIKQKKQNAHRNCMIAAFVTSTVFLACYLTYHFNVKAVTKFQGQGIVRPNAERKSITLALGTRDGALSHARAVSAAGIQAVERHGARAPGAKGAARRPRPIRGRARSPLRPGSSTGARDRRRSRWWTAPATSLERACASTSRRRASSR